jgi:oxidase EvaA
LVPRIGRLATIDASLLRAERSQFQSDVIASALETHGHLHDADAIISWFTEFKTRYDLNVESIPLDRVQGWYKTEDAIMHEEGRYFSVIAVSVEAENREVTHWTQPLVSPRQEGIVAFVVKKINGILHFLMQAKVEAGNFDVIEMAPTVQCLTGSYKDVAPEDRPPFLDHVIQAGAEKVRLSTLQSEEGGRFFREANRNLLIEGEHDFPTEVPERYIWMTLNQIKGFIKYNNFLNVQCRSLTSSLGFL